MQIVLGTAQFGMAYGIAGSGNAVPDAEAHRVLHAAWEAGVRTLDTATAYGDSETKLAKLCNGLAFEVVSKVPAIPVELDTKTAVAFALEAAERSRSRLGELLRALMCHRADDLLGQRGVAVRDALQRWSDREHVAFGASCYEPQTLLALREAGPVGIAQLPGSALDQRAPQAFQVALSGTEVHLRSVFLQGLLLMNPQQASIRLPAAAASLKRWHAWVQTAGLDPIVAALAVAKSFTVASKFVIGVETCAQFDAIAAAWDRARPTSVPQLAESDLSVIDPRRWTTPAAA